MGRRWHRLVLGILGGVLCLALVSACGDDDGGGEAAATTEVPSGTTGTSTSTETTEAASDDEGPEPGTDDTVDDATTTSTDPDDGPATPPSPVVDVVAGTVAGHPIGAPAGVVIDALAAALGPPDTDTGWQATECPPADHARTVVWGGLFVHLGNLGEETVDGVRVDASVDPAVEDLVVLPPGVAWGDEIETVAGAVGAPAVFDEAFGWSEVFTEAFVAPVSFQAGTGTGGPFDHLMLGFVPVCR